MSSDYKTIRYIMPDFAQYGRNEILINLENKYPYLFRKNACIYSFYGVFSNALWNGGRVDKDYENVSVKQMKKVKDYYKKHNVVISFTFTNPLIREEHLKDEYCNQILEIFKDTNAEILLSSKLLEDYIRSNYPMYKINKSITFASESLDESELDKYNLLVINQNLNHRFDILDKIKNKDKIEILCDSICYDFCNKSRQHYTELGKIQLGEEVPTDIYGKCKYQNISIPNHYRYLYKRNTESKNYISVDEIHNTYEPKGYRYYKLSERDKAGEAPIIAVDSLVNHLIDNKYNIDIFTYIIERMILEYKNKNTYDLNKHEPYLLDIKNRGFMYV